MSSYPRHSVATITLLLGLAGALQASEEADPREADHVALRALRDRVVTAIEQQDIKALTSCFAREFAFTTVNQTVLTSEAEVQDFFQRMFHSDAALVTSMKTEPTADILTRFVDSHTGVCHGTTRDTYTMKSGKVVEMQVRWSATVVKQEGEWKVALAHAGTDFIDNPVTEGLTRFARNLGIGVGLGGLLTGMVLGRTLRRRR